MGIVWRHWLLGWAGLALLTLLRFGRLAFVAVGAFAFLLIDLPITLDGQEARVPRLAAKG